jgi:hypothetical protein
MWEKGVGRRTRKAHTRRFQSALGHTKKEAKPRQCRESAQPRRWIPHRVLRNQLNTINCKTRFPSNVCYAFLALGGKGCCVSEGIGDLDGCLFAWYA